MSAAQAITAGQVKIIHALKNRLKWDEEQYRTRLSEDWWVKTSKELTYQEAAAFIRIMEAEAVKGGVWSLEFGAKKHTKMDGREGMASPRQLRYIEGLWGTVSYARNHEQRAAALSWFLHRIIGVDRLEFVTSAQAHKVIEAMNKMKEKKEGGNAGV